MDDATRRFINDPKHCRLDAKTLSVSKIFDWYAGDFDSDPVGYFMLYADDEFRTRLVRQRWQLKVDYLDYEWSLKGR